jgi:hypothetical protein
MSYIVDPGLKSPEMILRIATRSKFSSNNHHLHRGMMPLKYILTFIQDIAVVATFKRKLVHSETHTTVEPNICLAIISIIHMLGKVLGSQALVLRENMTLSVSEQLISDLSYGRVSTYYPR